MISTECCLLLGSNLGNRKENLLLAKQEIDRNIGAVISQSSIYETQPWQVDALHDNYLNQALIIRTDLTAQAILIILQSIERKLGRQNSIGIQPRLIDIDILLMGNKIINTSDLIIPHPRMHLRAFTLIPLMEVAPYLIHPLLNKNIEELYDDCEDNLDVILLENE